LAEFNKEFAKRLGIDQVDWQQYYMAAIDPITEMHDLLKWASSLYYVGLLSNIMPGFIDSMLENGILPRINYTAIIDSSRVGAIKPEEEIYKIARQQARVAPEEILLVDDSRSNLMSAEKMGWHVLWFDDYRPDESVARVRQALEPEE
jgi:FMN phosphatase YigB (HAD superfamily)